MLPRADDIRQINVSRKRRSKKKRENKEENKEAQVYPVYDSGAYDIRRKGIHSVSERSRQLMHEEVQ
jgi:hypothetical protein